MIDQHFTQFMLVSRQTILRRKVHPDLARHLKSYNYHHNVPAELTVIQPRCYAHISHLLESRVVRKQHRTCDLLFSSSLALELFMDVIHALTVWGCALFAAEINLDSPLAINKISCDTLSDRKILRTYISNSVTMWAASEYSNAWGTYYTVSH